MSKCGGCGKFLSGGVSCSLCKATYHRQCVNLPTAGSTPKNWLCPCCMAAVPRRDNTDTPVKESISAMSSQSPQAEDSSNVAYSGNDLVLQEIRGLRTEMRTFRNEFDTFRKEVGEEIKELRDMYKLNATKMDEFSNILDKQESRLTRLEDVCKELPQNKELVLEINALKRELDHRDQTALANDIEISGITEHKGENPMHIAICLLNKIDAKGIDERDIVEARRVGPVRAGADGRQSARPLVVRVTRRAVRDQVLRCARTRRNVKTSDIDVAGTPRPVYINERLTKKNRLLFGQARALCKQHKWSFAWTRDGKVFVREASGKPAFRILSEHELKKIFQK